MTKRPAIFLDRDGTLIEEVNYLSRVEDLRMFPFAAEAIRSLKKAGFVIIVVTNQSGIGRGIFSEADMHAIHDAIQDQVDGAIDAFYFCPHLPSDGCDCRKPRPGMIEEAIKAYQINVEDSWAVGDKKIDIEAGQACGMRTALVLTGYGKRHEDRPGTRPTLIAQDLGAAAAEIIKMKLQP